MCFLGSHQANPTNPAVLTLNAHKINEREKKNPGNNIIHRENITSFTIFKKLKLVRERKKKVATTL